MAQTKSRSLDDCEEMTKIKSNFFIAVTTAKI